MKALVVDDDRVLADVLAFTLRREGFEVVLAYNGEAGFQRWAEEEPDLVVLDVNMPKLDGFAVCRRIREEERGERQADTPLSCSPCEVKRMTSCTAWGWAPTITSPNRSARASLWRGLMPSCAGRARRLLPRYARWVNWTLDPSRRELSIGGRRSRLADSSGEPAPRLPDAQRRARSDRRSHH